MRLLNASRTVMCYIGSLLDYTYIHEIMLDKKIAIYFEQLMNVEVIPTLPPVPSIDIEQYKRTLIERFSNPHIKVTALRVCMNNPSKFPNFFASTIVEQLKRRNNSPYCALAISAWIRYLFRYNEEHRPITSQDTLGNQLNLYELAAQALPIARAILNANEVFGVLSGNHQFTESVARIVKLFYEIGSRETLKQWINRATYVK